APRGRVRLRQPPARTAASGAGPPHGGAPAGDPASRRRLAARTGSARPSLDDHRGLPRPPAGRTRTVRAGALAGARGGARWRWPRESGDVHPLLARVLRAFPVYARPARAGRDGPAAEVGAAQHLPPLQLDARHARAVRAAHGASPRGPGAARGRRAGALAARADAARPVVRTLAVGAVLAQRLPGARPLD